MKKNVWRVYPEEKWEGRRRSALRNYIQKLHNKMEPRCNGLSPHYPFPQPQLGFKGTSGITALGPLGRLGSPGMCYNQVLATFHREDANTGAQTSQWAKNSTPSVRVSTVPQAPLQAQLPGSLTP